MQTSSRRQEAQIGITTVILSIILLYIGVSVSWRIVRATQQEAARSESTQAQIVAEQMVSLSGYDKDETRQDVGATAGGAGAAVKKVAGTDFDMIYVKVGEAIAFKPNSTSVPTIYYGYGNADKDKNPKLLIRRIFQEGSDETTQSVQKLIKDCSTCRSDESGKDYCQNGFRCFVTAEDLSGLDWALNPGKDTITIMVLAEDSYIGAKGLAKHYRAASYAQGHGDGDQFNSGAQGNEARVVEQLETESTTPGMFQFSVLVNGQIKGNN